MVRQGDRRGLAKLLVSGGDHEEQARELLLSLGVRDVHEWLDNVLVNILTEAISSHEQRTGRRPAGLVVNYEDWMHVRHYACPGSGLLPPLRAFGVQVLRSGDLPRLSVIVLSEVPT
jgi:hypothetical protein